MKTLNDYLCLKKYSNVQKPIAIKLNFREFTTIGIVSANYYEIETLSLNNNELVDLKGIEQFNSLRVLCLNSNKIKEVKELTRVSKSLVELNFK